MWTKAKSAALSLVCTRVLIGVFIATAVALPFLMPDGVSGGYYGARSDAGLLYIGVSSTTVSAIFICAYSCFVPAMITLFSLDRLLRSIRKDLVFLQANVRRLRIISWCCFAIAIIMLCGWPFTSYVLVFVAAAAAFFGLLVRVIKNVIAAACEIKDENDYTI